MSLQFLETGPTAQIETDHFERPFAGRSAGMDPNQQAGDDATVHLDFDTVLFGAAQMAAAEELFEDSEKQLDQPPQAVEF